MNRSKLAQHIRGLRTLSPHAVMTGAQDVQPTTSLDPFLFIVGKGRSGTTLLRAMFDSHPDMAIPPESHFIIPLAYRRRQYEQAGRFDVESFVEDLAYTGFANWGVSRPIALNWLRDARPQGYEEAVRAVFALYARNLGKSRYGEKTPVNVRYISPLGALFPEAVFIHLVRDGRDVTVSSLRAPFGPSTLPEAAIYWRLAVENGRRAGATLGPRRYLEVSYETLVSEPESTIRQLCGFAQLEFDPSMLRYYERAGQVTRGDPLPQVHENLHRPPIANIRNWRTDMGQADALIFEALAGRTLEQFGYERVCASIPWHVRVEAAIAWARVQTLRAIRRVRKILRFRASGMMHTWCTGAIVRAIACRD